MAATTHAVRYQVIWLLLGPQILSFASKSAYESALETCCDVFGECLCGAAQIWSSAVCVSLGCLYGLYFIGFLTFNMAERAIVGVFSRTAGVVVMMLKMILSKVDGIAVALLLVWYAATAGLALQQMVCGLVSFATVGKGFAIGLADPISQSRLVFWLLASAPCLWLARASSEAISVVGLWACNGGLFFSQDLTLCPAPMRVAKVF
ncbi:hypothetical protein U1Q18_026835 [Sarracenia purpurea var. burkii]